MIQNLVGPPLNLTTASECPGMDFEFPSIDQDLGNLVTQTIGGILKPCEQNLGLVAEVVDLPEHFIAVWKCKHNEWIKLVYNGIQLDHRFHGAAYGNHRP
ncbi:hypothetical protein AVEN_157240-1 [Araneus ventricosus]|uniref:Uncharacterized protein n=1 Tax=Araneus ventricosus TaxID=182803 RepID=A0A4Y2UNN1_ARAVE|nr:hypothetical protein AVEN_157240-1 [Araneus ventricosus]